MHGEVEHTGAVEHGDLDELTPQHLGILADAVELPDLVEPGQEGSAQFDGFGGRAGNRHRRGG